MVDDSDETEGRRMYRESADALARSQIAMAKRGVKMKEPVWCPFCKKEHVGGDICMGHHP